MKYQGLPLCVCAYKKVVRASTGLGRTCRDQVDALRIDGQRVDALEVSHHTRETDTRGGVEETDLAVLVSRYHQGQAGVHTEGIHGARGTQCVV